MKGLALGEHKQVVFIAKNAPEALMDQMYASICYTFGQIAIFASIISLGSVFTSVVSTTRKVFSVVISLLMNDSEISKFKLMGLGVVSTALSVEMVAYAMRKKGGKVKDD